MSEVALLESIYDEKGSKNGPEEFKDLKQQTTFLSLTHLQ